MKQLIFALVLVLATVITANAAEVVYEQPEKYNRFEEMTTRAEQIPWDEIGDNELDEKVELAWEQLVKDLIDYAKFRKYNVIYIKYQNYEEDDIGVTPFLEVVFYETIQAPQKLKIIKPKVN